MLLKICFQYPVKVIFQCGNFTPPADGLQRCFHVKEGCALTGYENGIDLGKKLLKSFA